MKVFSQVARYKQVARAHTVAQHMQKWFGRSILAAGAFAAALIAQPAIAQKSVLDSFKHCIDGSATDAESDEVGSVLGKRFYSLQFDASILSDMCIKKIASNIFGAYDEITSLQLVSFFWNETFLGRLHEVSLARPSDLSCDLSCLLGIVRRPLPSIALHDRVARDVGSLATPKNAFLWARTLFVRQRLEPDRISKLLDLAGNS